MKPLFVTLLILCWLSFMVVWFVFGLRAKRNMRSGGLGMATRLALAVLIAMVMHYAVRSGIITAAPSVTRDPLLGTVGILLCAGGVAFAIWARLHLGSNWGMPMAVKENPELVTSGPYRLVRHPIYTGMLVAILGTAFVVGPWWLLVLAIAASYFIFSAMREEKLLSAQFPNTYPAYRKRTKMLIPYVL